MLAHGRGRKDLEERLFFPACLTDLNFSLLSAQHYDVVYSSDMHQLNVFHTATNCLKFVEDVLGAELCASQISSFSC